MARIQCPHCGTPVTTEHINIQKLVAVCPHCDQVFSIEPFINTEQLSGPHEKNKRPEYLNIEEDQGNFQASYLWRKGTSSVLVALAAVFGGLAEFIGLVLVGGMFFEGGEVLGLFLGAPLMLLGMYLCFTVLLNRIKLTITDDKIDVHTEPIYEPFVNRSVSRAQVAQVKMVKNGVSQDPDADYYTLYAYSPDGTRRQLVSGLQRGYAQYLAQQITNYLDADQVKAIEELNTDTSDALVMGDDGELIPASEAEHTHVAGTKNGG